MLRTIMSRTFLLRSVAAGCVALHAAPVWAITATPSWESPELIPTDPTGLSPMPIDRVDGQDRFLDFDHFGVAGLAVPRVASSSLGVAYWRRHPVVGWTQQNTGQSSSGTTANARSQHASFAFDRSERPVIAAVFDLSDNKDLYIFQLQENGIFFARQNVILTNSDVNAGTSIAFDALGRAGIAWVTTDAFVQYTLDADGNGTFDDDVGGTPLRIFAGAGTRPSLDFDPIARPYIGLIDENDHVGVASGDLGLTFSTMSPDPDVESSFVSLAVNPLTGLPAVAYNDLGDNLLNQVR